MKILQKMGEKLTKRYRGGSFFFVLPENIDFYFGINGKPFER